ncbi:MAG: tetratricopeptide repeat protein [Bacteroidia bacterium]|nr:tetratricopeptide repeat protein [Bacteroidia bacterium]
MRVKTLLCTLLTLLVIGSPVLGQNNYGSEKDLLRKADKLFAESDFEKAMPLYEDLVSNYPDNYHYNYCYGICILKAGKVKPRAIPFLERAAEISITTDYVFYYLAKAYSYANRFDDAIKAFKDFRDVVNTDEAEKYLINLEISNCEYAALNTSEAPNGLIVDKKEILKDQVIDKSNVEPKNGKYILLPKKYQPKEVTDPDTKYAFLTSSGQVMYYSVYDPKEGKDIVRLEKKGNGQWGKPEKLPAGINTKLVEAFPITGTDQNELFFSSNGHQGFGGLDIYRTKYDPTLGVWSVPENIGHPINSVYDDYFYAINEEEQTARFVSDRHAKPGTTTIYDVSFRKDDNKAFIDITGSFFHNGKDDGSRAIIRVLQDDREIYATSTHPVTGDYNLRLPAFGEYTVAVERNGFKEEHRGMSLAMGTPREFDQELIFKKLDNGQQRLFINNMYESGGMVLESNVFVRSGSDQEIEDEKGGSSYDTMYVADIPEEDTTETYTIEIVRPDSKKHSENVTASKSNDEKDGENSAAQNNNLGDNINSSVTASIPNDDLNADATEIDISGIVFQVQIGAYKDAEENALRSYFREKNISDLRFKNRDDGTLVVLTGESRSFRGILSQLRKVKAENNCGDAFPVAYYNGKEISVLAAKEWIRKQK